MSNARGLRSKLDEFRVELIKHPHAIFCITQTWLDDSVFDSEICDDNYDIFRGDRILITK